jgi:hypothetical protein
MRLQVDYFRTGTTVHSASQLGKSVILSTASLVRYLTKTGVFGSLKGLSHEIDFKNVDENGQILALLRAAAGF